MIRIVNFINTLYWITKPFMCLKSWTLSCCLVFIFRFVQCAQPYQVETQIMSQMTLLLI